MGPAEGYVWRAYETASGKIQERKSTKLFKVPKKNREKIEKLKKKYLNLLKLRSWKHLGKKFYSESESTIKSGGYEEMQNQSSKSKMAAPSTRQKKWRRADNREKKWRPTHTLQNQKKKNGEEKKETRNTRKNSSQKLSFFSRSFLSFLSSHTHGR